MVLNRVLDSKEEGLDTPKREEMENTVNKNADENPGVSSKMSDSSVDFPPQAIITWLLVSVAVGLVTIYTMIQFISNKLTKDTEGKKTEKPKRRTDHFNQAGANEDIKDFDLNTEDNRNESEEHGKMTENGSDLLILQHGSLNAEKHDFNMLDALENGNVERLETNESVVCEGAMESTGSVHMGTGFSGNLSIGTEGSKSDEALCDQSSNAAEDLTSCRSTATLADYDVNHGTVVTVNRVQLQCFSCNPRNHEAVIHEDEHSVCSSNHHGTTSSQEQGDKFCMKAKKAKIDKEENHSPSTTDCVQTTVNCEHFPVHQNDCNKSQENDCVENNVATKTISESLNFLSNYHTPRDKTDGLVVSKNTTEDDEFIFPQDYETTTEKQPPDCPEGVEELETLKSKKNSRYLKYVRDDPVFSKSLDSQMEVLKKGCQLLEKKPSKSSLRGAGSDGSLEKFVHFPEDIRNIRTVYKYVSLDELWRRIDAEESAEQQRTQSLDN